MAEATNVFSAWDVIDCGGFDRAFANRKDIPADDCVSKVFSSVSP